ncbi:hypothetical protein BCR33DRAFT_764688 [Rhizoclosmatium globosum]|uniref:Uncharacterized protein n=1 Tax=Rhizoclosmatium globosum TaxID=329046 RepID=A0A1Y2CJH1_9FUNG|nr:hypothetical protein BCR33DRAFT_764688 [Rhizoclosmatium globosum]|eukprot:ORY47057.1 hypothetical protein BCR33DRAFT_764688 [Rhizoclosmatium globosum]
MSMTTSLFTQTLRTVTFQWKRLQYGILATLGYISEQERQFQWLASRIWDSNENHSIILHRPPRKDGVVSSPDVNEDQNERVRDGFLANKNPDVGNKQNEKQDSNKPEEHVHRNLEPLNEDLDVSSDGGTDDYFGFNPLVDFWVGPKSLLNEILGNDLNGYDEITYEEELKELREIMLSA